MVRRPGCSMSVSDQFAIDFIGEWTFARPSSEEPPRQGVLATLGGWPAAEDGSAETGEVRLRRRAVDIGTNRPRDRPDVTAWTVSRRGGVDGVYRGISGGGQLRLAELGWSW